MFDQVAVLHEELRGGHRRQRLGDSGCRQPGLGEVLRLGVGDVDEAEVGVAVAGEEGSDGAPHSHGRVADPVVVALTGGETGDGRLVEVLPVQPGAAGGGGGGSTLQALRGRHLDRRGVTGEIGVPGEGTFGARVGGESGCDPVGAIADAHVLGERMAEGLVESPVGFEAPADAFVGALLGQLCCRGVGTVLAGGGAADGTSADGDRGVGQVLVQHADGIGARGLVVAQDASDEAGNSTGVGDGSVEGDIAFDGDGVAAAGVRHDGAGVDSAGSGVAAVHHGEIHGGQIVLDH